MKQFGLDIELDEAVAQGNYSNLVIISHSTSEFILDFATMLPGLQKARVKSRIILTPEHAKRLLLSLQDNIVRYESNVGKSRFPGRSRFPSRVPRWVRPEAGRGRGGGAGDRNWGAKQGTGLGLERDGVLRSGTAGCLPTLSVFVPGFTMMWAGTKAGRNGRWTALRRRQAVRRTPRWGIPSVSVCVPAKGVLSAFAPQPFRRW